MALLEWLQNNLFVPLKGPANIAAIVGVVVVSVIALVMLSKLPPPSRRRVIATLTFLAGGFYVLEFFLPAYATYQTAGKEMTGNPLTPWKAPLGEGVQIIGTFAVFLGMMNLTLVNGRAVARRAPGWGNNLVLVLSLYATLAVGVWKFHAPDWPQGIAKINFEHSGKSLTVAETAWELVFNGIYAPLDATMFSLLAFFITSAAFRAFRVRSIEATLLMTTAFIVMIGLAPFGRAVTELIFPTQGWLASFQADNVKDWVMKFINTPMKRGILIGYQVGALAMALRIWLNLEKGSYFDSA